MFWLILIPFGIAHILVIWLESDALVEYIKLFRLTKIISDFDDYLEQKKCANYKEYILKAHNNFFVRLITCPICLVTWLSGISCILVSIFIYWWLGLVLWLPIAYTSLILYKIYTKLSK